MSPTVQGRPAARILRSSPAPSQCLLASAIPCSPSPTCGPSPQPRYDNRSRRSIPVPPIARWWSPVRPRQTAAPGKRLRTSACHMPTYGCRENRRSTKGSSNRERLCHPPARRRPPRRGRPPMALLRPLRRSGAGPLRRSRLDDRRDPGGQHSHDQPGRRRLRRLEDPSAWAREIVWRVQVLPADGEVWVQEFGVHTPSEAVAGFLAALVTHSSR
ncbi:DUF317 domain-containing protein [Streptomyces sp. NPDC047028]|uniref:DUF317 domain-containing protein n=1 Tax=Streptomyces sp. NPDC047028 TaxID=3155793 RepID=UPI0033D2EC42